MAATEGHQSHVFGIVTLIISVILLVFLILVAINFGQIQNGIVSINQSNATFLFWTAIVLAVIVGILIIISLFHIFKHKSVVYDTTPTVKTKGRVIGSTSTVTTTSQPVYQPVIQPLQSSTHIVTNGSLNPSSIQIQSPANVSSLPMPQPSQTVSAFDIPFSQGQTNNLINLVSGYND